MAKGKRNKSSSRNKFTKPTYDSDDERTYSGEQVPDKGGDDFYHDEVDQFHMNQDQILLDSGATLHDVEPDSDKEEVLAFDDEASSDEEDGHYQEMKQRMKQFRSQGFHEDMASDLEDDEPVKTTSKDEKAWGAVKSKFYGGHDSDIDEDLSGSEPEAAALEEEEALAIQKRLLQQMDDDDIGLDMFKPAAPVESRSSEKITKDLSKLSKREKLHLVKKQSPELLELIDDYKLRVEELQTRLLPVFKLIQEKKISKLSSGAKFITSKVHIYLNYLVNFSYYLMLKAKQSPIEHHPVIKRLLQYRNIMKQTDVLEPRIEKELDTMLQKINNCEQFSPLEESEEEIEEQKPKFKSRLLNKKKKQVPQTLSGRKRLSEMFAESDSDGEADINKGGRSWGRKRSKPLLPEEQELGDDLEKVGDLEAIADYGDIEGEGQDERRAINYTIEKNKGLTTRKRKELRNPRVKFKVKYRRANIRRKGQVRVVRTEVKKYSGEMSGIRAGIKKSVKFKY